MLRLRDIMTADVVTVSPDLTIREAMELFAARHVSGAPVVASGRVIGIVSATDLLDFASSLQGVPAAGPQRPEASGDWDDLPGWETEAEPPATYFTEMWTDVGADLEQRFDVIERPEWNALEEHTVSETMTRAPICRMGPAESVEAAADYMRRARVHRVLVMEGERLIGIVTTTDVAKAVADHKLSTRTYVFNRAWHFGAPGIDEEV
jgi:CBS domain-containing protein